MQGMQALRLLSLVTLAAPIVAQASDFGCKVLLCLADPRGPLTEAECRPPIRQLYKDLAKGKPFPTCVMASGPNGTSYAQQGYSYYDDCPSGTAELAAGTPGVLKTANYSDFHYRFRDSEVFQGIGNGDGVAPSADSPLRDKVCVGKQIGSAMAGSGDSLYRVNVYDKIVTVPPANSPRYIDVFVDNAFFRRVRW